MQLFDRFQTVERGLDSKAEDDSAALGHQSHHRLQPGADLAFRIAFGQSIGSHSFNGRPIEPAFDTVSTPRLLPAGKLRPRFVRILPSVTLPGDQVGHVIVVGEVDLNSSRLANRGRMKVVFHGPLQSERGATAGPLIHRVGQLTPRFRLRRIFTIIEMVFRLPQRRQPVRPLFEVRSTRGHKHQFPTMLHGG